MEKLRFTIRFISLLASFPVIMFVELTREEKGITPKQTTVEKVSEKSDVAMISYYSPFVQAIL